MYKKKEMDKMYKSRGGEKAGRRGSRDSGGGVGRAPEGDTA